MNTMLSTWIKRATLIALLAGSSALAAEPLLLKPVDEAAKNPAFFVFRARLLQAVARRDTAHLLSVVDPEIMNGFGGSGGIAEFKTMWEPEKPESKVWSVLMDVLTLGGKFEEGGKIFAAPYTGICFPEEPDPFEHVVVVGEKVRLRKSPSADAEVVGSLSWEIVKVPDNDTPQDEETGWIKITAASGKTGYISRDYVRSPLDMRVFFADRGGRWVITTMVSGD